MSLHVESQGSGAPLVMLHGWGMHSGMWGETANKLATRAQVHCVDMPGHGHSAPLPQGYGLDDWVQVLAARFDAPLALCGWSLGGLVALRWAELYPQQITKLILVASTPCFVQRPGWDCAMPSGVFQAFAASLTQAGRATLLRFLGLQVQGGDAARAILANLREQLLQRGEPHQMALQDGLALLCDTDLRLALSQINQPALVIAGARDMLVPFAAAECLAQTLPDARLVGIAGAAHVPFLSHPKKFVDYVADFLR